MFVDLLTPCAIFSKCLQSDEVDIFGALNSLLKTLKETDKLASKPLAQWTTYSATLKKCTKEDGKTIYQSQLIKKCSEAESYYSSKYEGYYHCVSDCIKSRLCWSDLQLMRDIVFLLSSQGWEKLVEEESDMAPIDRLVERFAAPLEATQADTDVIKTEFCDMIAYAVQYIAISSLCCQSVWWRLFTHQTQPTGPMFCSLLSLSSPFQHRMESSNVCFPCSAS